jgi:hypothetical protein
LLLLLLLLLRSSAAWRLRAKPAPNVRAGESPSSSQCPVPPSLART